jgi:hypothetical protein
MREKQMTYMRGCFWATVMMVTTIGLGCADGNGSDTGPTDREPAFENEGSFGSTTLEYLDKIETGDIVANQFVGYWPLRVNYWPLHFVELEAPPPPYEIRAFTGAVMSGVGGGGLPGGCHTETPLSFVAYLGDVPPSSYSGGELDLALPPVPYKLSVEAWGELGMLDDWTQEVIRVTLDEPVIVEESGSLWIGVKQAVPSGDLAACLSAFDVPEKYLHEAATGQRLTWQQNEGSTEWLAGSEESNRPALSVTIGY